MRARPIECYALLGTAVLVAAGSACRRGTADPKAPMKEQLLAEFGERAPRVGDKAPDFTARDLEGNPRTLSQFLARGPVVLDFANYT